MLALLLGTVGALLVLLVGLLVLPVRLSVSAASAPARVRVRVRLLGPVLPWWALVDTARRQPRADAAPPRKTARAPRRARLDRKRLARMTGAAPRLLGGLLGPVRVERLRIDGRFGFDDPATTGEMFGMLAPVIYGAGGLLPNPGSVRVVPVFDRECLEGEVEIALAVEPIRWFAPMIRFGWAVLGPERGR